MVRGAVTERMDSLREAFQPWGALTTVSETPWSVTAKVFDGNAVVRLVQEQGRGSHPIAAALPCAILLVAFLGDSVVSVHKAILGERNMIVRRIAEILA